MLAPPIDDAGNPGYSPNRPINTLGFAELNKAIVQSAVESQNAKKYLN